MVDDSVELRIGKLGDGKEDDDGEESGEFSKDGINSSWYISVEEEDEAKEVIIKVWFSWYFEPQLETDLYQSVAEILYLQKYNQILVDRQVWPQGYHITDKFRL